MWQQSEKVSRFFVKLLLYVSILRLILRSVNKYPVILLDFLFNY